MRTPVGTLFKAPGTHQAGPARLPLSGWKKPAQNGLSCSQKLSRFIHSTIISLSTSYVPGISYIGGAAEKRPAIPDSSKARCPRGFNLAQEK